MSDVIDLVAFKIPVHDPLIAVLACGTLIGAGAGITLRSLGSAGGSDIMAVTLNQKFNLPMGRFFIYFCYKKLGLGPFDINLLLVVLIILKDLFDIIVGRLEGRNSLIFFNLPRTGIICCQG